MMAENNSIFEMNLYNVFKSCSEINSLIVNKKIKSILTIKKSYLALKNKTEETLPKNMIVSLKGKDINCYDEIQNELERSYNISIQLFKSYWWGEFSRLNSKKFPELYSMMVDQNGDILRSYDDFRGTVATMDFHGYTQFSKDLKYNKTPLQEFGDILPQKIEHICTICKSIVYEMEGDALIIIGPENPIYIFNAVLCVIELCKQKPFKPNVNPKIFHRIEINNPMIKPFEINAAITTGGRVFINRNGHIIGTLLSEASRILKIINTKKPNKSGIIINDKIHRKLDRYKNTVTNCHLSIFDFDVSDPFIVDVKGTRLNIREIYLEKKKYIEDTKEYSKKLSEEIKKKNASKWQNILSYYINLVTTCLNDIKCTFKIGTETFTNDKIKKRLEILFYDWLSNPTLNTIKDILRITSNLYDNSEEIRDVTAVYHEFVQENFNFIVKRLDEFYESSLKKEGEISPSTRRIVDGYENELEKLKSKFPIRRILGSLLSTEMINSQMQEVPYMGKK